MEILGISVVLISFAITIVIGGIALFRSMYFFYQALSNTNKDVVKNNYLTSFNFTNAVWVPGGLTLKGREYRAKAIKCLGIFIILSAVTAILASIAGM
ncbi:hypothetical protein GCM10007941_34290 [Amphritea balenae]|nr:hypothetical protein GCM10007941_34290 [Amphritea balenae]